MLLSIILAVGYPIAFVAAILMILDYLRARDLAEREERAQLLVHIQSPATAIARSEEASTEMMQAVTFDDDEGYWESQGYDVRKLD